MNTPNFTPHHDTFAYWEPVEHGRQDPDEYQTAMVELVRTGQAEGVFYQRDMREYVKQHADFIPAEAWDLFQATHPTEGGVMGYEVFHAVTYLREQKIRADNQAALATLTIGQKLGTLYVNGKRITKCVIESFDGFTVNMTGLAGAYPCKLWATAATIPSMIERAKAKGWRK